MSHYSEYENLIASARPRSELWRLLAGVGMTGAFYLGFVLILTNVMQIMPDVADQVRQANTPLGLIINLYAFALLLLALGITLRRLHQRGMESLLGPLAQCWAQFYAVLRVLAVLYVVVWFIPGPDYLTPQPNVEFFRWLALLPIALGALLVQTSTEEIVFRGYFQSQLAARFTSPFVWMVLPSVVFGLLHYAPDIYGENAGLVVLSTSLFGIIAADLTARSGTLGPAIAVHFVNNVGAILLVGLKGWLSELALYVLPLDVADVSAFRWALMLDMVVLLCIWLAARLALRR